MVPSLALLPLIYVSGCLTFSFPPLHLLSFLFFFLKSYNLVSGKGHKPQNVCVGQKTTWKSQFFLLPMQV